MFIPFLPHVERNQRVRFQFWFIRQQEILQQADVPLGFAGQAATHGPELDGLRPAFQRLLDRVRLPRLFDEQPLPRLRYRRGSRQSVLPRVGNGINFEEIADFDRNGRRLAEEPGT